MAEAHNDLGVLYFQGGNTDQALAHLREAVELEPDNMGYRKNVAGVLLDAGLLDEAVQAYQAVLTREPDDVEASLGARALMFPRGPCRRGPVLFQ